MKLNRIIVTIILSIVSLILIGSINTHAEVKNSVGKQGNEQILIRDVTIQHPVWCGNNTVAVIDKKGNIQIINISNSKKKTIRNPQHIVFVEACTADGEWIIYSNKKSVRPDKGINHGGVTDFWRYNLKTGERQKFAIAEDGGRVKISPDGKKVLFTGCKPRSFMEQPPPKWNLVWSKEEWKSGRFGEARWLNDSSNIVIRSSMSKLFIENIDAKTMRELDVNLGSLNYLKMDNSNRIYFLASDQASGRLDPNKLFRCSLKDEKIKCANLMPDKRIQKYDISPDGKTIVFVEYGKSWETNTCVWLYKEGTSVKCISPSGNVNSILSISPDVKYVVYTNYRKLSDGSYTNDLFVINLTND